MIISRTGSFYLNIEISGTEREDQNVTGTIKIFLSSTESKFGEPGDYIFNEFDRTQLRNINTKKLKELWRIQEARC